MLKKLIKLFKILNTNSHPGLIAHGICIGMLMGFFPKDNLFWYILTVFFLFIRVNKASLGLSTLLFSFTAHLIDPLFDQIGYAVLTFDKLEPFFAKLLEIPFVSFTKFNNTIVMGSLVFGLCLYIPLYFLIRGFIALWRKTLAPAIRKTKLSVYLSKLPFVQKIGAVYASIE